MKLDPDTAIALITAPQITPFYMFLALLAPVLRANSLPLLIAFVFATLIQIVALAFYARSRKSDIFLSDRGKRTAFFALGIASYIAGFALLLYVAAPFIVSALMLAYAVNTTIALVINRFDKVSIHVWGISGPAVALFYQYGLPVYIVAFACAAVIGAFRIKTKAHNLRQVLEGLIVPIPITALVIYVLAPLIV